MTVLGWFSLGGVPTTVGGNARRLARATAWKAAKSHGQNSGFTSVYCTDGTSRLLLENGSHARYH
eukprot:109960-Pyramimonas_sp.AAC.1